jgi:hypothetical protein
MVVIAEIILCCYAVVATVFYFRRPGHYLVRLPTNIASIITLFAASTAIRDLKGISHLGKRERAQHLEGIGSRYGYGSYAGEDGSVHVGIEKSFFVSGRTNSTKFSER